MVCFKILIHLAVLFLISSAPKRKIVHPRFFSQRSRFLSFSRCLGWECHFWSSYIKLSKKAKMEMRTKFSSTLYFLFPFFKNPESKKINLPLHPPSKRSEGGKERTFFDFAIARVVDEVCLLRSLPSSPLFASLGCLMKG